jgi:glycosidase
MTTAISAIAAGTVLRNFIHHFFDCEVCRVNFINAYDNCDLDVCNRLTHRKSLHYWKRFPAWLWELHNSVNVRLMKEHAEQDHRTPTTEDEIEKRFPRTEDCPQCWKEDGAWDEDTIYKFLRVEYWPDDPTTEEFRKLIGLDKASLALAAENDEDEGNVLYSPLVIVWVVAGVVVVAVLLHKKLERDRAGFHKKTDEG